MDKFPLPISLLFLAQAVFAREVAMIGEEKAVRKHFATQIPPWIKFPDVERVDWFNRIIETFWPQIGTFFERILRTQIEPLARESLNKRHLYGFKFENVHLGVIAPRINGVKVYDLRNKSEVIMDIDFRYNGDMDVGISLLKIHAGIADLHLHGKLRIVMAPLIDDIPFIGGLKIFLLQRPELNFDMRGVANILDLPGLSGLIKEVIQEQIANQLLLPNKITITLSDKISPEELKMPKPTGVLAIKIIAAKQLLQTDGPLQRIEPFVVIQQGIREKKTKPSSGRYPKWDDDEDPVLEFPMEAPESEELQLFVMDEDSVTAHDFLGQARLNVQAVLKQGEIETWIPLEGVKSGEVHLKTLWFPATTSTADYGSVSKSSPFSRALLMIYLESCSIRPFFTDIPTVQARLSVESDQEIKATKALPGFDVNFQEGFSFLIKDIEKQTLKIVLVDVKDEEEILSLFEFKIERVFKEKDFYMNLTSFPLINDGEFHDGNDGSLTFSAKLMFLAPPKRTSATSGASRIPLVKKTTSGVITAEDLALKNLVSRTLNLDQPIVLLGTQCKKDISEFEQYQILLNPEQHYSYPDKLQFDETVVSYCDFDFQGKMNHEANLSNNREEEHEKTFEVIYDDNRGCLSSRCFKSTAKIRGCYHSLIERAKVQLKSVKNHEKSRKQYVEIDH